MQKNFQLMNRDNTDGNWIVSIPLCIRKQMYQLNRLYTTYTITVAIITTIQLSNMFRPYSAIIVLTKQWC